MATIFNHAFMRVDRISRLLLEFNPREIFNVKFLTADSLLGLGDLCKYIKNNFLHISAFLEKKYFFTYFDDFYIFSTYFDDFYTF